MLIEVFLMIDENGKYVCADTRAELDQVYYEKVIDGNRKAYNGAVTRRVITVSIDIPKPNPASIALKVSDGESRKPIVKVS